MDGAECSAVYIDDRVKAERWVRRSSFDVMTESSISTLVLADESETLQTNVKLLLDICRQSRGLFFLGPPPRVRIVSLTAVPCSLPLSFGKVICCEAGRIE